MRYLALTIILCCTISSISAQLTPAQYRSDVAHYSWELKSAALNVEQAQERIAYERTSALPNLSASGRLAYNFKRVGGEHDWGSYVEPQIIQTLYGGGVVRATVEGAEVASKIAQRDADYTLLEIEYAADYAYWNLWAMGRLHAVMERYVELIGRESEVIERRFQEGYVAKGDLLMIASRLSEAEYELISAEQNRVVAQHNLNILRGREMSDSVRLAGFVVVNTLMPKRLTADEALAQRPDYAAVILAERAAKLSTRALQGAYNPQLTGGITGSWRGVNPNISGVSHNLNGSIYLALSIPIYHFGERRRATAISKMSEQQSRINTSILHDTIVKEEGNAWANLTQSYAQMIAASHSLEIAGENLEISTYAYNEGEVSIVELMQAQLSWMQIYTNAIYSEYNYQLACSYYRRTVGGDL
ncbi:MAG: TolC family protein [Rikenellaceae bacterium]